MTNTELRVKLDDDRGNHPRCTVIGDETSWPAWIRERGLDATDDGPSIGGEEVIKVDGVIYIARWDYDYQIFNVVRTGLIKRA